jgi:hypothetical protein
LYSGEGGGCGGGACGFDQIGDPMQKNESKYNNNNNMPTLCQITQNLIIRVLGF